jgi:hypothetical protein
MIWQTLQAMPPSSTPSQADIHMTKAIVQIATPLGIPSTTTSSSARMVTQV